MTRAEIVERLEKASGPRHRNRVRFRLSEWLAVEPFLAAMADRLSTGYFATQWPEVASDTLDGWATSRELEPLVRRKLLTVLHDGGCGCKRICNAGLWSIRDCAYKGPTWSLTERGLRLLCPSHPALFRAMESGK